jgi:hypothetical protein
VAQITHMRVLFTIQILEGPAGASLYVRDCAIELLRQGHQPVVFSTRLGRLAEDIRGLTIPVIDRLEKLTSKPDIIHGNAPVETVAALLHFPDTPAIFVCHAWDNPDALPPRMPRVMRYLAVDETCRDHLVCQAGIHEDQVLVRFNAVDLDRFPRRGALPDRPGRALIFSNNASEANYVPAVRQACDELGVDLDVGGQGSDRPVDLPETILASYDLVFAKARCALEALATGTAVIACDAGGLGSLITSDNLIDLRRKNFGRRALDRPVSAALIAAEIRKYDADDAARVTDRVRQTEGLSNAVRSLVTVYGDAIEEFRSGPQRDPERERLAAADFLQTIAPFSNTFYATDRLQAASREVQALRKKLGSMEETLRMLPLTAPEQEQVRLIRVAVPSDVPAGELFSVTVELENASTCFVSSLPPFPIYVSYHWLSADRSAMVSFDGLRSEIFPVLAPGSSVEYVAQVRSPDSAGSYWLRMALVQEQVAWFDPEGSNQVSDGPVVVTSRQVRTTAARRLPERP